MSGWSVKFFPLKFKIGGPQHPICEPPQAHETIELPFCQRGRVFVDFALLYNKGLSLADIARQTGRAKSTVRKALMKAGIELRPKVMLPTTKAVRKKCKGARPYFGFCFFQGQISPDPREYQILLRIHSLWKAGSTPSSIANDLNVKKLPSRSGSIWHRWAVTRIMDRFTNGTITIKEGNKYELR